MRTKMFGLPAIRGIDRNARARIIAYAKAWNARNREPGQHVGPITRAFMGVLAALLAFANERTGSCFPSYEAIAARANCARSTVAAAIRALEFAKVIREVINRRKRLGSRVVTTSNAYVFRDFGAPSENRPRTSESKESLSTEPLRIVVLDPRTGLDSALISLATAIARKEAMQ